MNSLATITETVMDFIDCVNWEQLALHLSDSLHIWRKEAYRHIEEYKKFLHLKVTAKDYNNELLWPSQLVKDTWEQHILFVEEYQAMCMQLCENMIYYQPFFKKINPDDRQIRYDKTLEMYKEMFGNPPVKHWERSLVPLSQRDDYESGNDSWELHGLNLIEHEKFWGGWVEDTTDIVYVETEEKPGDQAGQEVDGWGHYGPPDVTPSGGWHSTPDDETTKFEDLNGWVLNSLERSCLETEAPKSGWERINDDAKFETFSALELFKMFNGQVGSGKSGKKSGSKLNIQVKQQAIGPSSNVLNPYTAINPYSALVTSKSNPYANLGKADSNERQLDEKAKEEEDPWANIIHPWNTTVEKPKDVERDSKKERENDAKANDGVTDDFKVSFTRMVAQCIKDDLERQVKEKRESKTKEKLYSKSTVRKVETGKTVAKVEEEGKKRKNVTTASDPQPNTPEITEKVKCPEAPKMSLGHVLFVIEVSKAIYCIQVAPKMTLNQIRARVRDVVNFPKETKFQLRFDGAILRGGTKTAQTLGVRESSQVFIEVLF